MKYIDAEKLKAELERQKHELKLPIQSQGDYGQSCHIVAYENILSLIDSLQQKQPDFDDVDPKHLVHSHYTKVREIETGRVFWAEYSSEAAEWYEAVTGRAYSSSDVEIVKEQPEVELDNHTIIEEIRKCGCNPNEFDVARHFYSLGLNARKE